MLSCVGCSLSTCRPQKPGLGMRPVSPEELSELLARLRRCTMSHICAQLQVGLLGMREERKPTPDTRHMNKGWWWLRWVLS